MWVFQGNKVSTFVHLQSFQQRMIFLSLFGCCSFWSNLCWQPLPNHPLPIPVCFLYILFTWSAFVRKNSEFELNILIVNVTIYITHNQMLITAISEGRIMSNSSVGACHIFETFVYILLDPETGVKS